MPYSIDRFNGTQLTVVEDGTIDSTLDIKLIGKNYAGYGEAQNENFVHLLENFSNPTAPPRPLSGQIWFNSSTSRLQYYSGSRWKSAGAEAGTDQPLGLTAGDLWFKTSTKQLFVNNGTDFTLIGPEVAAGFGTTQFKSKVVSDSSGGNHAIIECIINDETVYVISKTEFTIAANQLTTSSAFSKIKEGITLAWTKQTTTSANNYGVTDNGVDSEPKFSFWGTASSALGIVDETTGLLRKSNYFATATNTEFPTVVRFRDPGYTLGDQNDLAVYIDTDGTTPVFKNTASSSIRFVTNSSGLKFPLELDGNVVLPGYDKTLPSNDPSTSGVVNIGSTTRKFNIIHANSLQGTATNSNYLLVDTTYRQATIDVPTTNKTTIVVRDADGDINGRVFKGTAEKATDADKIEIDTNSGTAVTYLTYSLVTDGYTELKVNPNLIYNSATNSLSVSITGGANISGGEYGSIPYQSAANTTAHLTPNKTTTRKFLSQVGDGTVTNAPTWVQIGSSFPVKLRSGSTVSINLTSN